jgi:hypothetical protein
MNAPLPSHLFFKSRTHGLKCASVALSVLSLLTAATPSVAAPQAVELIRLNCDTRPQFRSVHIYQAGSIKSGEGGDIDGCKVEGPIGACMTEPFEGSKPISLRNSSVHSSDTRSVTTMCHTVAESQQAPGETVRLFGAGISRPAESAPMMSAGGQGKRPSIDFVYSNSNAEQANLVANDGRWQTQARPGAVFKTLASADAYLKKISMPLVEPPKRITPPTPPTPQSPPGEIKAQLIKYGCHETAVAGEYVCTNKTGLDECKRIGLPSKVATKCGANIEAVIPVDVGGCQHALGRATEHLCATQAAFDDCKASVDQQKSTKCTKVGTGEIYTFHKSKVGIVGCDDYIGRANENLCFSQSGFEACKAAVDQKRLTKCINSATKQTYAHTLTKAEKLAKLAQIGCVYNNNASDSKHYKTATCKTESSYKQCEAMVDKIDLLDCALKTQ